MNILTTSFVATCYEVVMSRISGTQTIRVFSIKQPVRLNIILWLTIESSAVSFEDPECSISVMNIGVSITSQHPPPKIYSFGITQNIFYTFRTKNVYTLDKVKLQISFLPSRDFGIKLLSSTLKIIIE